MNARTKLIHDMLATQTLSDPQKRVLEGVNHITIHPDSYGGGLHHVYQQMQKLIELENKLTQPAPNDNNAGDSRPV
jgi:hypothetical protein